MLVFLSAMESQADKDLLTSLYLQHRNFMFHVANRILDDPQAAEDVVHDAFIRIMDKFHKLDLENHNKVKALFGIITDGLAKDLYRRRRHIDYFDEKPEEEAQEGAHVEAQLIGQERYEKILAALGRLGSKYSDTFLLRFAYDFSMKEIAELTGVSENTVRQRLHQTKIKLRHALEKEVQTE